MRCQKSLVERGNGSSKKKLFLQAFQVILNFPFCRLVKRHVIERSEQRDFVVVAPWAVVLGEEAVAAIHKAVAMVVAEVLVGVRCQILDTQ